MMSLVQVGAMLVPVMMGKGARTTALVYALANVLGTLTLGIMVRRDIPWLRYGWKHAHWTEVKRLSAPAIAFMGFPMGNAFNLQGTVLAVQYALGPLDVVIFSTARQVSRVALQMVQMVEFTFSPEMAIAYGAKNLSLVRVLHRRAVQLSLVTAAITVMCMMSFGPWFLSHWTGGHVPPSKGLLAILLLVVVFYSMWSTSSSLQKATNQHVRLSVYYFVATGVTIGFTYLFGRMWGLFGAAGSLLISELIMNSYVLPRSLQITDDHFGAFVRSMLEIPPSLLRRLSRSRPGLES
jgi:O-antigen/teichoic acid export membrane protein